MVARGDELVGDVDGVALVAVLGRRVPQPDVLADVLGGQGDGAVSADVGHGERAVGVDAGDGPPVAVADRLTCGGEEVTVVAAGDDDVADVGALTAADQRRPGRGRGRRRRGGRVGWRG